MGNLWKVFFDNRREIIKKISVTIKNDRELKWMDYIKIKKTNCG